MKPSKVSLYTRVAVALLAGALLASIAAVAGAAPMTVTILPSGDEAFIEDTLRSGQIVWQAEEDLTLSPGTFRFEVRFSFSDPDNIPVNPTVSQLMLLNWPAEFGTTIAWTFLQYSLSVEGPLNAWSWHAEATVGSTVFFPAGSTLGSAAWSTGGDDVDDIADGATFGMRAEATNVIYTTEGTLISKYAWVTKGFNPQPIPEPTALSFVLLGVLAFLRRRWRAGDGVGE